MSAQPSDAEFETSRIFVKGIPPTISDADFKKHFSAGGREVTDVKVILPRRIGYVGFKTSEDAKKAVRYFNKSYIRMSRIEVQLARPIADPALKRNWKSEQSIPAASSTALPPANAVRDANGDAAAKKRKRDEVDESDPKLREYLQTFQPGKTNAADETTEVIDSKAIAEKKKLLQDGESDDEYETIPTRPEKKQMREAPSNQQPEPPQQPPHMTPVEDNGDIVASPQEAEPVPKIQLDSSKAVDPVATDDDWLRSRTNRMLDLVADDEDIPLPPPVQKETREEPADEVMKDVAALEDVSQKPLAEPSKSQDSEAPAEELPKAAPAQSDKEVAINTIRQTARLFARNLAFSVSEDDLRDHFEQYGEVEEIGTAYTFGGTHPGGKVWDEQGIRIRRLLHVLPAAARRDQDLDEYSLSKLPLKVQQRVRKKAEASTNTFNWNALYMSQDAINTSVASRLGVSKSDLLDPTDASAAVKQAVAETSVIQETKAYFLANGVDLNALKSQKRGDSTILVKNFPHGTTLEELRTLFAEHGTVLRVLMPPSKTIAIVQYAPGQGKAAFGRLAYRRIKDSDAVQVTPAQGDQPAGVQKLNVTQLLERDDQEEEVVGQSLFVRNLNFSTTSEGLTNAFKSLEGFVSAKVKTKTDPKKPGQVLSMGFGFVAFRSSEAAQAAIKAMDGQVLDAHTLSVRASHRGQDAAEERRREDKAKKMAGQRTKIVVKNLPFEISKKELRPLFATYGTLRAVRLPKKMGQSTRGFAFAEFSTPKEAQNAIDALQHTHLLGRRLVLDYAEAEALDAEEEIAKMQKKVGGQVNKVALAQLTGKTRKKITIGEDNEDEFAV
ncbi:Multiple RNA-binding domain-containing protein 1 like [Verticillium longisporum]|uniref:Multiple RNA-binding domain-containing protein 1 n=1 Tax=Verticillium longisporum TaxID=100787 RepID=A0A8I2ZSY3_VERLO|nr:Multiple RNA-binding domain-containing protein 1 like [Verticillium longisporum]